MLKKFISFITSIILIIAILCLTSVFTIRNILNGDTINNLIINELSSSNDNQYSDDILSIIVGEEYEYLNEYIDSTELTESYTNFITEYFKYYLRITDNINEPIYNMKEIILDACTAYTNNTGIEVDQSIINDYFKSFSSAIRQDRIEADTGLTTFFKIIYSKYTTYILIIVILICLLLIFLLCNNSITKLFTRIIISLVINGIISTSLSSLINSLNFSEELEMSFISIITDKLNNISSTSFIIAGILLLINIIIFIISKIIKSKENKEKDYQDHLNNNEQTKEELEEPEILTLDDEQYTDTSKNH